MKTNYNTETLKPWIEFIDSIYKEDSIIFKEKTLERSQFLSQIPKLGDFVATDKKGNVVPEPSKYQQEKDRFNWDDVCKSHTKQYQEAQERVKFEGWEITKETMSDYPVITNGKIKIEFSDIIYVHEDNKYIEITTYSDLTGYGLKMIVR